MEEHKPLTLEEMEQIAEEFRYAIEYAGPNSEEYLRATFLEDRGLTPEEHKTIWDLAMKVQG